MKTFVGIFSRETKQSVDLNCEFTQNNFSYNGWYSMMSDFGHRGAIYQNTPLQRNFQRLRFCQESTGNCIIGQVRLDNRQELSRLLGKKISEHWTGKDYNLVLEAYSKWGVKFAKHLLGDFAFVLYDRKQGTVVCVRDHLGIEPFYYSLSRERMIFGNDLEEMSALILNISEIDEVFVTAHLLDPTFRHPERTFLKGISKLPPANVLEISSENSKLWSYWDPENAPDIRFRADSDYVDCFRELLQSSIKDRINDSEHVGVHVTGGLDSSGIAVLASRFIRMEQRLISGFSWQPSRSFQATVSGFDERDLIDAVRAQENLSVDFLNSSVKAHERVLRRDIVRQPTEDTLISELEIQQKAANKGVDVILSGWGGDEFISYNGRGYYAYLLRYGKWVSLYCSCQTRFQKPWKNLIARGLLPLFPSSIQNFLEAMRSKDGMTFESYINADFLRTNIDEIGALNPAWNDVGIKNYQLSLLRYGHLAERLESWAASGSRKNLEYRFPLLDCRIVEFALGLPAEKFIKGSQTRCIMRQSLKGIAPATVRRNIDKSDPALSKKVFDHASVAMHRVGSDIRRQKVQLPMAQYLDMKRLQKRLDLKTPIEPGESRSMWHALQFLGIQTT